MWIKEILWALHLKYVQTCHCSLPKLLLWFKTPSQVLDFCFPDCLTYTLASERLFSTQPSRDIFSKSSIPIAALFTKSETSVFKVKMIWPYLLLCVKEGRPLCLPPLLPLTILCALTSVYTPPQACSPALLSTYSSDLLCLTGLEPGCCCGSCFCFRLIFLLCRCSWSPFNTWIQLPLTSCFYVPRCHWFSRYGLQLSISLSTTHVQLGSVRG